MPCQPCSVLPCPRAYSPRAQSNEIWDCCGSKLPVRPSASRCLPKAGGRQKVKILRYTFLLSFSSRKDYLLVTITHNGEDSPRLISPCLCAKIFTRPSFIDPFIHFSPVVPHGSALFSPNGPGLDRGLRTCPPKRDLVSDGPETAVRSPPTPKRTSS